MPKSCTRYSRPGKPKETLVKLFWGPGRSPAASLKRSQERLHERLHVCRPAWKLAGSSPGHAA
eukprot:895743-Pyramimonas_sp.AAC.1